MDDPGLDVARHLGALRALQIINRVSLASTRVWSEVRRIASELDRPVRVLDLACGGGDVLVDVGRRAERAGVGVELHGCDLSPVAVDQARRSGADLEAFEIFRLDALTDALPVDYDLITCSLFLHHLERGQCVELLRRMSAATRHVILVQDLRRTRLGYFFAWVGLHALTRSDVARVDGLISVRGAFTSAEVVGLCREAGLEGADVRLGWPQRFTIRWTRS